MAVSIYIKKDGEEIRLYKSEVISTNLSMERKDDRSYKAYLNISGKFDFNENNVESINFDERKRDAKEQKITNLPEDKARILKTLFEWARGNNNDEHYFEVKVVEAKVVEGIQDARPHDRGGRYKRTEYNITTIRNAFIIDYHEKLSNTDGNFDFDISITYSEKSHNRGIAVQPGSEQEREEGANKYIEFENGNFASGFRSADTEELITSLYGQDSDDFEWEG